MSYRVYIERDDFGHTLKMLIFKENQDGSRTYIAPFEFKEISLGEMITEETMKCTYHAGEMQDFLQACADAAWDFGIRPKQIEDHSSELKATKFHLEDMRKLVFKEEK